MWAMWCVYKCSRAIESCLHGMLFIFFSNLSITFISIYFLTDSVTIWQICRSSSLSLRSTEHLFLQLASVHGDLRHNCNKLTFSNQQAENDSKQLLDQAELLPKCITRDLKWGVPVPVEKFKDKVYIQFNWFPYLKLMCGF